MKKTCKLMLIMAMFVGTAMADGDMGSGGRTCPQNCPPPDPDPFTQNQTERKDIYKGIDEERRSIFIEVIILLGRLF